MSSSDRYPPLLRLGGWRWLKLLIPLLALRLSAFLWGVTNVDETTFYVISKAIRSGAVPYVDIADIKPLLAYLAFLPGGLGGWHMWPMQVLGSAWILATAALLARATERWTGQKEAGWTAAWLAVLATCCAVPSLSAELLFNLPIAAAVLCGWHASRGAVRWTLAAGLCVGIASLFKHQAGIAVVALATGMGPLDGVVVAGLRARNTGGAGGHGGPPPRLHPATASDERIFVGPFAHWSALAVGAALPWALVGAAYAAMGHWSEFADWNFTRNFSYTARDPTSALLLLCEGVGAGILLAAPVAWVLAVRAVPRVWHDPFGRMLSALLVLTCVAVSVGGRFYLHYFLQFVPPLAVLAAPEATALLDRWSALHSTQRWSLRAGFSVPALAWVAIGLVRGGLGALPAQDKKAIEIAQWVKAHSRPADRLFVWGAYSPVYYLAERLPGTRYVDASPLAGNFDPGHVPDGFDPKPYQSPRDVQLAIADLKRNQPALIIDTAPADLHDWRHFPLADFPALQTYVKRHYEVAGHPAGAVAYRRVHRESLVQEQ